jgi:outer membrane lipoprotein-sorting protein
VIAAKGGLEKLRGLKTIVAVQTLTTPTPEGKQQNTVTTNYMEYPNRFRIEAQVPNAVVIQAFDGTQMWMQDPRGVHDAPETIARLRSRLTNEALPPGTVMVIDEVSQVATRDAAAQRDKLRCQDG